MNKISPFDFYLLRMPILPVSRLPELNQKNMGELVMELHHRYSTILLQEAIYLASPDLYDELLKWLLIPVESEDKKQLKLVITLYKYILRMSVRCTPYGLFAGFSLGKITEAQTALVAKKNFEGNVQHSRLDMNYVAELSNSIVHSSDFKNKVLFFPNNSLYKAGENYRYYEYRVKNKRRYYYLVSVKDSIYLSVVLEAAQPGLKIDEFVDILEKNGIQRDLAVNFLNQLISSQLLVSELEPTVTGKEFYDYLIEKLEDLDPEHKSLSPLKEIDRLLKYKASGVEKYKAIQAIIEKNFPQALSKDLIQTDLYMNLEDNVLNKKVLSLVADDLNKLSVLNNVAESADLAKFKTDFYQRYEDQEIPLLEALDSESGIGYGNIKGAKANHTPLIDDLRLPGKSAVKKTGWTAYRQLVFHKFNESQQQQAAVLYLTDEELAPLSENQPAKPLPSTFYAMGQLLADNGKELDAGKFKFQLSICCGPTAIPLLGRFSHSNPEITAKLRSCAQKEQEDFGDAILAEVIHLPEARVGNILQRPQMRDYEIPFLGNASVPQDHQIPVSDMMVSVRNGNVILRSKRLNKVIVPRLTSAHNYGNGITIYKFLCDLQHQENNFGIVWDWGVLSDQKFLPRIEYKHIIISRARWLLSADCYAAVKKINTREEIFNFMERNKLPQKVLLAEGDNELLLDFASPLAIRILEQALKKGAVTVYEFVQDESSQIVSDSNQEKYINELIIPFFSGKEQKKIRQYGVKKTIPLKRSFALGTEWTYAKIYCGTKWADKILADYLLPLLQQLKEDHLIESWFFIRYYDPESHIRLRFLHAGGAALTGEIIDRIHHSLSSLVDNRIIQKIQYDTYHREIERYGASTIKFSEEIFHHDSVAVINFLSLIEGDEGERYRWLFALRGVDLFLNDFGLNAAQKLSIITEIHQSFFTEFKGNTDLNRQLNDKYRQISAEFTQFIAVKNDDEELGEAIQLFETRSVAIRLSFEKLKSEFEALYPQKDIDLVILHLLPSYLHMFLNRIFIANQRLHELVVHHYLLKFYTSVVAREKFMQTT